MNMNCYQSIWKEIELQKENIIQKTLLIGDDTSMSIVNKLSDIIEKENVITCRIGEFFDNFNSKQFEIDVDGQIDFELLLKRTKGVSQVIFLSNVGKHAAYDHYSAIDLEKSQKTGLFSFFKLVKQLIKQQNEIDIKNICIVTEGTIAVDPEDQIKSPFEGAIEGFAKSTRKELTKVSVTAIDIEEMVSSSQLQTILEVATIGNDICIRKEKIYERRLERINFTEKYTTIETLKKKGAYLIIGGTSGIGEQTAYYLAKEYQATLVLFGRKRHNEVISEVLQKITSLGGKGIYLKTDINQQEEVADSVRQIQSRIGRLDGIYHSAIVLKDKLVKDTSLEELQLVLDPKSKGLIHVLSSFKAEKPDFIALYSSLNSFYANKGQANYAAACTFKDTYAHYLKQQGWNTKIINWGYWGDIGIVANNQTRAILDKQGIYSIEVNEGMEAMAQIINSDATQCFYAKLSQTMEKELKVIESNSPEQSDDIIENLSKSYELLDELGRLLVLKTFQERRLFVDIDQRYNKEELRAELNTIPKYNRLWDAVISLMVKSRIFIFDKGKISLSKEKDLRKSKVLEKCEFLNKKLLEIAPDLTNHITLVTRCTEAFFEMLSGEIPAVDIIFPKGSFEMVGSIYANNQLSDVMNIELRNILDTQLKTTTEPIKILEIGAGTGGTTKAIVKSKYFKDKVQQYCFTDLATSFLLEAKKRFGTEQFEYKLLNIEETPEKQDVPVNEYDVIIATNVLHAVKSVTLAIENAKKYLKKDGTLLLNELTGVKDFTTLIFGFLDGWWLYKDEELRIKNSPILNPHTWKSVLEDKGFENIKILGNKNEDSYKFQSIIAGHKTYLPLEETLTKSNDDVRDLIINSVSKILEVDTAEIDIDIPFSDIGVDSIMGINIVEQLNEQLNIDLKSADLFSYSTTRKLSQFIEEYISKNNKVIIKTEVKETSDPEITITTENQVIKEVIIKTIAETLQVNQHEVDIDIPFSDIGVDSIMGIHIVERLNEQLDIDLKSADLFSYSTTRKLTQFINENLLITSNVEVTHQEENELDELFDNLDNHREVAAKPVQKEDILVEEPEYGKKQLLEDTGYTDDDIAIIGISGIFPGAENVDQLWEILKEGKDMVKEVPAYRWDGESYYNEDINAPGKSNSKWGAFIEGADIFDPLFFNITPKEALMMDPQQRLFLRESWKALEDAGYTEQQLNSKRVGVYVGVSNGGYETLVLENEPQNAQMFMGNASSILSARISYYLNLSGPSLAIDTACSSSLVALHNACQNIKSGDCEMALVGGACVLSTPDFYLRATKAGMLSPTGKCRAFDDDADGFVPGEAVGTIVIKSAKKALEDNDRVYGIIKGTSVNQDGKSNGITAPSGNAQVDVISNLYKKLNIAPESISYIETHGTGTKLGDPIEMDALTRVYRESTESRDKTNYCPIGSIKTNLGHTLTSAGVVGLIKVLLSFKNKQIAPSIHYNRSNRHLKIEETPFYVADKLQDWEVKNDQPRRAALSSFGFSGTNCHVVLEEPQEVPIAKESVVTPELFVFGAKTESQLIRMLQQFTIFMSSRKNISLSDVSYTLCVKRNHFKYRAAVVASTREELIENIEKIITTNDFSSNSKKTNQEEFQEINHILIPFLDSLRDIISIDQKKKDLTHLANFFVTGYKFDLAKLFEKRSCQIVDVPAYPFDEESYWIGNLETTIKTEEKVTYQKIRYLTQNWIPSNQEAEIKNTTIDPAKQMVCFHLEKDTKEIKDLSSYLEQELALEKSILYISLSDINYQEQLSKADIIIDLTDSYNLKTDSEYERQITVIQNIIKENEDVQMIHLVNQKNIGNNYLAQGFYKMLGAEYSRFDIKSIAFDDISKENITYIIHKELRTKNEFGNYKYEGKERLIPRFSDLNINGVTNSKELDTNGLYVLSGGLGDLGFEVCKYLLSKKIVNIALIGERSLPEKDSGVISEKQKKKLNRIQVLKELGATISIHRGNLENDQNLKIFIKKLTQAHEKITGVFHCAGKSEGKHPAFINKEFDEIKAIQNAKYDGFKNILEMISKPEFFISFSSISAVSPVLALGVSDYASANYYMDIEIDRLSKTSIDTRFVSIQWSNWYGTHMGSKVSNKRIHELGIDGYNVEEGITILDKIVHSTISGIITPVKAINSSFNPQELLLLSEKLKIKKETPTVLKPEKTTIRGGTTPLIATIQDIFSRGLKIPIERLDEDTVFNDFGIDSILIAELVVKIENELHIEINPTIFLEYPTISELAGYLKEEFPTLSTTSIAHTEIPIEEKINNTETSITEKADLPSGKKTRAVAVIGMSCNYPGADNIYQYWENLKNGVDSITEVPESRWKIADFFEKEGSEGKTYGKWGGFIKDIEDFDYDFFGITKEEALHFDPLVRQVLENAVQLLTHSGYQKEDIGGTATGVFIGARAGNFSEKIGAFHKNSIIGIGQNFIAAYLSHHFNLTGPSLILDSACSSSLVSIHYAFESIKNGDCKMAIAGGVDLLLDEKPYQLLSASKAISPEGKCKVFDKNADGFVPGEGSGLVLLKDLDEALKDGDIIYGVVESTSVNNDGNTMGVTTPNFKSQYDVIKNALDKAQISPDEIGCIEAHGTGTMIGDPIELKALTKVFREYTNKNQFCAIGSVKSNFGHLLSAAGIASFQKMTLSIYHGIIPPTLNCTAPNSRFKFEDSPFFIAKEAQEWDDINKEIRKAGMSGFGFGGTNCHIIVRGLTTEERHKHPIRKITHPLVQFNKQRVWPTDNMEVDGILPYQEEIDSSSFLELVEL